MSVDPHKLESHLGKVRGRSKYVPHDAAIAMGAFVCPRADGYGAREGVIPPGVAAANGLIPRGLREVSVDTALHSARQDDDNPVTAQEQYRAYYGRGAMQQAGAERGARPRVVLPPAPEPEQEAPEALEGQDEPEVPEVPAVRKAARKAAVRKPVAKPQKAASRKVPRQGAGVSGAARRPARVFSAPEAEADDPDTLEGFYAGLGRERQLDGVAEQDWPETPEDRGEELADATPGGDGDVPPVPRPRAHGDDTARRGNDLILQGLREQLAEQKQLAKDWYEEAERRRLDLERHQILLSHQNTELQRLSKEAEAVAAPSHDDGPVRVYLGMDDVKLKVAGRGWDCNVMGHLCYSRGRNEVALVVTDPGYGSDLLANVSEGECVIVSAEGRTACQYRGHCDKIYGETDSQDFITVMRFACDPNRALA